MLTHSTKSSWEIDQSLSNLAQLSPASDVQIKVQSDAIPGSVGPSALLTRRAEAPDEASNKPPSNMDEYMMSLR